MKMKVWFEGKTIWYDTIIHGITPNCIEIPDTIIEMKLVDNDVLIKSVSGNFIIKNLDDYRKTIVYDMKTGHHPKYMEDVFNEAFKEDTP
jgi:hypothetical protein